MYKKKRSANQRSAIMKSNWKSWLHVCSSHQTKVPYELCIGFQMMTESLQEHDSTFYILAIPSVHHVLYDCSSGKGWRLAVGMKIKDIIRNLNNKHINMGYLYTLKIASCHLLRPRHPYSRLFPFVHRQLLKVSRTFFSPLLFYI